MTRAIEEPTCVTFAHTPELKGAAVQYFSAHNPAISTQLAEIVEAK